ncbi:sorting nexin-5 isoform X2 [Denticeps clupeoides]|nr:sorting nexin-5-like isoform X2 [Denticeps clupeoides]
MGVCVCRTYEDFEWLQQSLFAPDEPDLHGVIFPPLPAKLIMSPQSQINNKTLKQLGFLALGDCCRTYCEALELYLQQVALHPILSKNKALETLLTNTESPGKQRAKKGIFNRLSQVMEEKRKESHKDVDDFFQNERDNNSNMTALTKVTTERFLDVVLAEQRLSVASKHLSSSIQLWVNQEDSANAAFSKICLKTSKVFETIKRNFEKTAENNISTLGLGLDLQSRYQEAEKEMLFRRTCKLVELEAANKNTERAKANKKGIMEEVRNVLEKQFDGMSSMARQEVGRFHQSRVALLRTALVSWCEQQLNTATEIAALYSEHLEACQKLPEE